MIEDTFVNVLKEIFGTNTAVTNSHKIPFTAADGTPAGLASISDLASVLGVLDVPITFETPAVKEKIVGAFGGVMGGQNHDIPGFRGEITYRQALNVSGQFMNNIFRESVVGGTFNEFKYFRNARTLQNYCFQNSGLTSIIVPEGVYLIGGGTFASITAYIELPSTITSIGDYCFWYSGASLTVKLHATTPPAINYSRNTANYLTRISVPNSALAAYQADAQWGQYGNKLEGF